MIIISILQFIYSIAILFIILFCLQEAFLAYTFLSTRHQIPVLPPLPLDQIPVEQLPFVTIQLPIFNEQNVAERIIAAAVAIRYPISRLEIQILDDSNDHTLALSRQQADFYRQTKNIEIHVLHRSERHGYKAGALSNGLQCAKGDFIAIFDADFIPEPDFLLQTLPYLLQNPQTAAVQTRWEHLNPDYSLLTRLQALFIDTHFFVEQTARCAANYCLNFNGTAGIWRRTAIEKAGGWQADTLTEDLDLSYRAQLNGLKIQYTPHLFVPAELPAVISAAKSQQYRWVKGGSETARKVLPLINKSRFPLGKKIMAYSHLLSGSVYIAVAVMSISSFPLLYFSTQNISPNLPLTSSYILIWLLSQSAILFVYAVTVHFSPHFRAHSPPYKAFVLLTFLTFMLGLSFHNAIAALSGWAGIKSGFVRTPKYNLRQKNDIWQNKPYAPSQLNADSVAETMLAIYFLSALAFSLLWKAYIATCFYAMATFGLGMVIFWTWQHNKKT